MRKISVIILILLIGIITIGINCVFDEKVIDLIITDKLCVSLSENHETTSFNALSVIDYSAELDKALADNGLDRSEIISTKLVSASYEVTSFKNSHDWNISGSISVERKGSAEGPEKIADYTALSVSETLNKQTPAILDSAGVSVLNRAFEDYLSGESPVLILSVNNAIVDPAPDSSDPIVFDWDICLVIHVVVREEYEVPDPF